MRWLKAIGLFLFVCTVHAQQVKTAHLGYESVAINRLLPEIERIFDVQYSYLDSIVAQISITLPKDN